MNIKNPAALAALGVGDLENFMVAASPGGIERQEKMGQTAFVGTKDSLPIEGSIQSELPSSRGNKKALEQLGFVFGPKVDDLFVTAIFPAGWTKQATDHSMWSDLVDDKNRRRGNIFYKAAFYDRSAHMCLITRFDIDIEHDTRQYFVKDRANGSVLFKAQPTEVNDYLARGDQYTSCEEWLSENKRDWQNPAAYWD